METFYSLQGEGIQTGKPAFFARIGGCDVGCSWCDVKESWNAAIHPLVPIENIPEMAAECGAKAVLITGGEPLLYNLDPLCNLLKEKGFETYLETSGSGILSGNWDWICLSPKKKSPPADIVLEIANELKIIIRDETDFLWAEIMAELVSRETFLLLQPEWSRRNTITPVIIDFILKHPKWRISLQIHKYLGIP
ncbi:MAG: 7-carboxy-7-deazaguanine synthase QueE [Bacteroidetes bacterium]|nr:7-carboxy-7-deazaguanine synthase QueE [Bacteroidota bacterium]